SFREPMQLLYLPEPRRLTATPYFEALADQRVDAYVAASDVDLSSPVDDRPFFFLFARPADLVVHPPGYILSLYRLLAGVVRISAVLVLLPLIVLRRRRLRAPRAGPPELCHDGRAAGPAPGRGSRERRIQPPADRRPTYAPHRNRRAGGNRVRLHSRPADSPRSGPRFPLPIRLPPALTLLVTLGIFLGLPFPTALRGLAEEGSPLVPWAIGVNGFASVVGSTAAVATAMVAGLRVVLLLAVAL